MSLREKVLVILAIVIMLSVIVHHALASIFVGGILLLLTTPFLLRSVAVDAIASTVDGKPVVRVTIRDKGEGIAEEKPREIFQQGTTTPQGKGRGAGLHWCAHLIANMHGRPTVESKGEGQGANFQLLLPSTAS